MKKSFERVGVKGAKNELRSFEIEIFETSVARFSLLAASFAYFFSAEEIGV